MAALSASPADSRFSPALCFHSSPHCHAGQHPGLQPHSSGEQAEWKAGVAALSETSHFPASIAPVSALCCGILGSGRKQEWQHKGSGIPPAGLLLPREFQQRNWLLILASLLSTSSLVKHAENVTSCATRPIEPFHRTLRNFLLCFNRRQAYRKNSSSHTSGNSSSKNTY